MDLTNICIFFFRLIVKSFIMLQLYEYILKNKYNFYQYMYIHLLSMNLIFLFYAEFWGIF